ncbi:PspC domain-containing protein [Aquimarina pacifica]|uniref:PspC domain-containing protein n=1 Tax=Aquimarina pacifica TaxID=1296415 RepID=UPI000470AAFB|nr:PspC domain-containing protein [Aquimarina pacifica]
MNKTVNINLAGIFFHIDEDAYLKLQRYIGAIRKSFTDSQGSDEIIADIEARIAELFSEKIKDERQVIGNKEIDEVIAVMGQPEDYQVDEEIFEDESNNTRQTYQTQKNTKQLFRDTTNSYVGGVSSGLGHYFGIDPIWIRLAWILFTVFSSGAFVLIYIAFWIFVPEAQSTADFLAMKGEAVNISNIEKKIKEGFDGVADTVKNVDYKKYSNKVKSSSTTFFDALGDVLLFLLKIFVKFIGALLIVISGITLISLFIGLFTLGTVGFMDTPLLEYFEVGNHPDAPIWVIALLSLFAVGIPFFFLFILGLKILIKNIKSIGTPAKLGLLGVWILAIIGFVVLGVRQATLEAYDAQVIIEKQELPITSRDTLTIEINGSNRYAKHPKHKKDFYVKRDQSGNKVIVTQDIELYLKASKRDTLVSIEIEKQAQGKSYDDATERAEELKYAYQLDGNTLLIDGYAITNYIHKFRDQEVKVTLTLPEGITLYMDKNTSRYNNSWKYDDYITVDDKEEQYLQLINGKLECNDCPEITSKDSEYFESEEEDDSVRININSDDEDFKLKIDEKGVELNNEPVKVKIDEHGIEIKTEK